MSLRFFTAKTLLWGLALLPFVAVAQVQRQMQSVPRRDTRPVEVAVSASMTSTVPSLHRPRKASPVLPPSARHWTPSRKSIPATSPSPPATTSAEVTSTKSPADNSCLSSSTKPASASPPSATTSLTMDKTHWRQSGLTRHCDQRIGT